MNYKLYAIAAIFLYFPGVSSGHASSERPLPIVQVCLGNEQNFPVFASVMQMIAQSENMKFIDGSAETRRNLEAMGQNIPEAAPTGPVIHIGVERGDGMGLTAANLGLPKYEVALGFSEGSSSVEAHQFADTVVSKLEERWHVEILPPNVNAHAMKICK